MVNTTFERSVSDLLPAGRLSRVVILCRFANVTPTTSDAEFLVVGMRYLTALARTDLTGDLNYTNRSIVEKLFQTYTTRIERFHETWNGSQASAKCCLTAYSASYDYHRSHKAVDNQPPVEAL